MDHLTSTDCTKSQAEAYPQPVPEQTQPELHPQSQPHEEPQTVAHKSPECLSSSEEHPV